MSAKDKKNVPRDRDPEQVKGSPDAGIAREWPRNDYNDEKSTIHDEHTSQQDDGANTAGKKASEEGEDL